MSTAAQPALLTAEEFIGLPHDGLPRELVRGRIVVENAMPGSRHGYICLKVGRIVGNFAEEQDIGRAMSNDTFIVTKRGPDTVRGSDICYYSFSRLPKGQLPEGAADQPPELVFEVRSPSDRWVNVMLKMAEYLEAGVSVVCIVDPKEQTISVYRPDESAKILSVESTLTLSDILPGFSVPVRKFFE